MDTLCERHRKKLKGLDPVKVIRELMRYPMMVVDAFVILKWI